MDSVFNVWPLYTKPLENELMSSWMFRNAHRHGQKTYTFFKKYLSQSGGDRSKIWSIDIDRSARRDVIELMSRYTNTSEQRVLETTLVSYENKLYRSIVANGNSKWILPVGHYHTKIRRRAIMYCPNCLSKDKNPYFRKEWKLSLSYSCLSCNVELRDSCWNCGSYINFIRSELGRKNEFNLDRITICHNCNEDLRKGQTLALDDQSIFIQKELFKYIDSGEKTCNVLSYEYFEVLHHICGILLSKRKIAFEFQRYVAFQCDVLYKPQLEEGDNTVDTLDVRSRADIIKMAFYVLDQWPINFFNIMDSTQSGLTVQFLNRNNRNRMPSWFTPINQL